MKKGANLGTGVAIPPSKRNLQPRGFPLEPLRPDLRGRKRTRKNGHRVTGTYLAVPASRGMDGAMTRADENFPKLGCGCWEEEEGSGKEKKKKVSRPSEHAQGPWTLDQTRARPPPLERGSAKSLTNKIRTGRPAPPLPGRSSAPRAQDLAATGPAPARLATALGALERQALKPVLGAGA